MDGMVHGCHVTMEMNRCRIDLNVFTIYNERTMLKILMDKVVMPQKYLRNFPPKNPRENPVAEQGLRETSVTMSIFFKEISVRCP